MSTELVGHLLLEILVEAGNQNHTKINGSKNNGHPIRIQSSATDIGSALDSFAAANEAIATGGVIIAKTPKYNTNRCAYIGSKPD